MFHTSVESKQWNLETLTNLRSDEMLPCAVVRKILAQIASNEASFNTVEQTVTHSIVQSKLNKISTTNVVGIAKEFAEYISDKAHIRWVLCRLVLSCASQPLFTQQYTDIFETITLKSNNKAHVSALCSHVTKVSLVNAYIRGEIVTNTNVPQEKYLEYCKVMAIKKRCVGIHRFQAVMNSRLPRIVSEQFLNECVHSLIEAMYEIMYSNPGQPLSVFVECIIALIEHSSCEIVYMDELYEASQNPGIDIRSRFLLLNVIDSYFKKNKLPVPTKYT